MAKIKSLPNLNFASLLSVLLWFAVGLCAVYWGMKMGGQATPPNAQQVGFRPPVISKNMNFGGVLGANAGAPVQAAAPTVNSSRFVLQGTASNSAGGGTAIISVDGKPAKTFRVGQVVVDGIALTDVSKYKAVVGDATIEMPKVVYAMPGVKSGNKDGTTGPSSLPNAPNQAAKPGPGFIPPGGTAFNMPAPLQTPNVNAKPVQSTTPPVNNAQNLAGNVNIVPGQSAIINNIPTSQAANAPEVAHMQGAMGGSMGAAAAMAEEQAMVRGVGANRGMPPNGMPSPPPVPGNAP